MDRDGRRKHIKDSHIGQSYEEDRSDLDVAYNGEIPDSLASTRSKRKNYDNVSLEPFLFNNPLSSNLPRPIPADTLGISTILEANELSCNTVHKFWGMVELDAVDNLNTQATNIDFVVVIDHSSSMRLDNKLAFVQATIEYLISQLNEAHRFCLIQFNQEVDVVTEGLLTMTPKNKKLVLSLLREIKPEGSTNISDALFTGINLLKSRQESEQSRISSIMLLTDGLANIGLRGAKFLKAMKEMTVPQGLTINTFGYGLDHDSQMLQNMSFCSKGGVYYYIETVESIAATFGECLAGLLSTVAHNVNIRLVGQDGCRIVSFYTKYPIIEHKSVKEYSVSLGSMYSQESKTILFKLSLRKMEEMLQHQLLSVIVTYTNTLTGVDHKVEKSIYLSRPNCARLQAIPVHLDKHINRYAAAAAIEEAVSKALVKDFYAAKKQIEDVIDSVQNSVSAKNPTIAQYCEDLIKDLRDCMHGMEDSEHFVMGIHYAHAYSTMYYMERSTGTSNLLGVDYIVQTKGKDDQSSSSTSTCGSSSLSTDSANSSVTSLLRSKRRNHGYGYVTYAQEEEALKAKHETRQFVTGYLENVL